MADEEETQNPPAGEEQPAEEKPEGSADEKKMAESAQNIIELKSISSEVMENLLEFVYTGKMNVNEDNVLNLLAAANLLQLNGVKDTCSKFLMREIKSFILLEIYKFAGLHNCTELKLFTKTIVASCFERIIEDEEFLVLEIDQLLEIISIEDLVIDSEIKIYNAIIRWIYYDSQNRAKYLPKLLQKVLLITLPINFLTDVVDQEPLIRNSLECRDIIDEVKKYHLRPDLRSQMCHPIHRNNNDDYLVVLGGFCSDHCPSDSVEMLNPRTMQWSELPNLPTKYRYLAACSIEACIYVIGGFDGKDRLNSVSVLDLKKPDGWHMLQPMHFKRGLSVACVHEGLVYVCGGFDGQSRLRSLEVYNPKLDEWSLLSPMITPREGAGSVVVNHTLYCIGGYDGYNLLKSVEKYDIKTGVWSSCSQMYMRRSGAGCAALNESIYVCGGYGGAYGFGSLHLDSVEVYNVLTNQWTLTKNLNVPRCYVGACSLSGKIFLAAGYNGLTLLDTVEIFDPVTNKWTLDESCRMNHERCDTGVCVVRLSSQIPTDFNYYKQIKKKKPSITDDNDISGNTSKPSTSSSPHNNTSNSSSANTKESSWYDVSMISRNLLLFQKNLVMFHMDDGSYMPYFTDFNDHNGAPNLIWTKHEYRKIVDALGANININPTDVTFGVELKHKANALIAKRFQERLVSREENDDPHRRRQFLLSQMNNSTHFNNSLHNSIPSSSTSVNQYFPKVGSSNNRHPASGIFKPWVLRQLRKEEKSQKYYSSSHSEDQIETEDDFESCNESYGSADEFPNSHDDRQSDGDDEVDGESITNYPVHIKEKGCCHEYTFQRNDNNQRRNPTIDSQNHQSENISSINSASISSSHVHEEDGKLDYQNTIMDEHENSLRSLNNNQANSSLQYSPSKIVLIKDSPQCNQDLSQPPDVIGIAPISKCNNVSIMNNETPNSGNFNEIQTCLRNEINHVINNFNRINTDSDIDRIQKAGTEESQDPIVVTPCTSCRQPVLGCERSFSPLLPARFSTESDGENEVNLNLPTGQVEPDSLQNDEPRTDGEGQEEVDYAS